MKLTYQDIAHKSEPLDIKPEAVLAVIRVETPSPHVGDLPDGRPLILNERHWFYKLSGKYPVSKTHPHLSSKSAGGYCRGADWIERQMCEHKRLEEKMTIYGGVLKEPALKSISMGLFQVMGFNHNILGYNSVLSMWEDANLIDDRVDLEWFFDFIIANRLDDELRRLDWAGFARGYNGPNYAINKYDVKLEEAYRFFLSEYKNFERSEDIIADVAEVVSTNPNYEQVIKKIAPSLIEIGNFLEYQFPDFSQVAA